MLERVTMPGIELPRLYIAENKADAELAMKKGVPFIRWKQGKELLISLLLMPTLKKMFPHILWDRVTEVPKSRSIIVETPSDGRTDRTITLDKDFHAGEDHHDGGSFMPNLDEDQVYEESAVYADDYRQFTNNGEYCRSYEQVDLSVHIGDLSSQVNLDILQNLKLMPKFIGDIMDCIKTNVVAGTMWSEGWNKKKAAPLGNFDRTGELRNLIIVDISASIPIGISSTMLTLIDTLRTQVHADLIVTGGKSRYYPYEKELPTPQEIRNTIPRSNEAYEFCAILRDHVAGHHYGHVISFGDNDCPANWLETDVRRGKKDELGCEFVEVPMLQSTIVEEVHHYHVSQLRDTGYALWTNDLPHKPKVEHDCKWCRVISNR